MTLEKEEPIIHIPAEVPAADWHAPDEKTQETLDKMILDSNINKYDLIILARRWAYELKNKEGETRSAHNLVPDSVKEILMAKVNQKTIRDLPVLRFLAKKIKGPTTAIFDNIGKHSDKESESSDKPKKK
ncbi:MAG: hypothetical protein A2901_02410 [Elusimicrobia bacterium RIFCSPLOWO2_01_FULL_54_10]|nr:MAG: hypothetical protein A2901_02410 [Elusimicrobia bacterium RIFCSPLOWO2_01_FULL_54_10]